MRKFTTTECEDFFRAIEAELDGPCEIVLVGGGAVALRYKGTHATTDLDLWSVAEARPKKKSAQRGGFWGAVDRATEKSKVPVPVQQTTIAEPPSSFEDRLELLTIKGLSKLRVFVPEAHDLAILKIARGEAHDLDAVEDIHRSAPLDLDTLVLRYRETTTQVMGRLEDHRLNFLAAVARLFGEEAARRVDLATALKAK